VTRRRSAVRDHLEFTAYRLARATVDRCPAVVGSALGSLLGDLFWVLGIRRGIVRFNLRLAFPEWPENTRRRLARQVARHFGRVVIDVLRFQRMGPDQFLKNVDVVGLDNAAGAATLGRGLFYLTAHLGSWEVAALTIGLVRSEPLKAVNRPLDNPLLETELARLRGRFGNLALGKRNVAREILQQLKGGGPVGILIDQKVPPEAGVAVPFFGHPAWTHSILARMVRRTGAPVVPAAALWQGPGRYVLYIHEAVVPDVLAPEELEDEPLTARFSAITEALIRDCPGQWLWYHDRWRHLRVSG
jgi:KDO2-lipid IV(A) lauroyltransferase